MSTTTMQVSLAFFSMNKMFQAHVIKKMLMVYVW